MSSTLTKSTRQAFGEKLLALGAQRSEIVVLDADLSKSTKSDLFAKKYPERFFEMGISEAKGGVVTNFLQKTSLCGPKGYSIFKINFLKQFPNWNVN
jgi:transketolase